MAIRASFARRTQIVHGRLDRSVEVAGRDPPHLAQARQLGLDHRRRAASDVAGDAGDAAVGRLVVSVVLGLHDLVAGRSAELRRLHERHGFVRDRREDEDVHHRQEQHEGDAPADGLVLHGAGERQLDGLGVGDGTGVRAPAPSLAQKTERDQEQADHHQRRHDQEEDRRGVGVEPRGHQIDGQRRQNDHGGGGDHRRSEQRDPVAPETGQKVDQRAIGRKSCGSLRDAGRRFLECRSCVVSAHRAHPGRSSPARDYLTD